MENVGRKPDLQEWTLGNVIKVNIPFDSGLELNIEMIFKAKKLDKITYEESMCPFLKTCVFLTNTSVLLVYCHLKKSVVYYTSYISGTLELQTSIYRD